MPRLAWLAYLLTAALLAGGTTGCGGAQAGAARHLQKGREYLAAQNLEKARVEFRNAMQLAPKDSQAPLALGLIAEKLGNYREAAQLYQGAIDVGPDDPEAHAHLGKLYLFAGDDKRALQLIEPVLKTHPDDAGLLTVRAAARVQQKDYDNARIDAEHAVQVAPNNAEAIEVLAGVYVNLKDPDKALALLERSIQKVPEAFNLRLIVAQIYLQEGRIVDAETQLQKLVSLQPAVLANRVKLAQLYAQENKIDDAEHALRQAVKDLPDQRAAKLSLIDFLADRRSRDVAEHELKSMIDAGPGDNELKLSLAKFYVFGGDRTKAETVLQEVIEREQGGPAGIAARDQLASLRLQDNDVDGALALVNEVLAKSPRDDDALAIRGDIDLSRHDPRSAIADLRAVLRDQPNALGVLTTLARAHLANGEPELAEETMRHAVESNPKDATLRLDFAQLLIQLGKTEQAEPFLAELIKEQPNNVAALDAQFRASLRTQDLATAKSAAASIAATRPKDASAYLYGGLVAEAEQRTDDALRLYAQAVDAQSDALEPVQAEMRLLVASNRAAEALKRAEELSARYPKSPLGPEVKGELLLRTPNRGAEAQAAFNEAIARVPKWWLPYHGLALVQRAANNPEGAIEILRNAQSVVENTDKIGIELAGLLEATGKPDEAIREYEEVLRSTPQSEPAINNLAILLVTYRKDQPSLDRAKELASRFANSTNPAFLDTYGWVLYKCGETSAAVPVLQRVVMNVPDRPLLRYHLGMAQARQGDNSEARDNLLRAVNSGKKFTGVAEAKATLDRLAKLPASASIASPKT
jgi:tetratricopeptide (TPR) repeat protein